MGVAISQYSDISKNEYIEKFCSATPISHCDPFWNTFLSFNLKPPKTSEDQIYFDSSIESVLEKYINNNMKSGNLGSLVQVFITRATQLIASPPNDNSMLTWMTYNALFVIKTVTKYLIENVTEAHLILHYDVSVGTATVSLHDDKTGEASRDKNNSSAALETGTPEKNSVSPTRVATTQESRLEMLIDALIGVIVHVSVSDTTYYLQLECINTLLILMSVYMYALNNGQTRTVQSTLIFRTLYEGRYCIHAPLLTKTLLNNYISLYVSPVNMIGATNEGSSIVLSLASGIWSALRLSSWSENQSILQHPPKDDQELRQRLLSSHPLAVQSQLLLLALTNHCINDDNLYRKALATARDTTDSTSSNLPNGQPNGDTSPIRINMNALHTTICATVPGEQTTLLVYLLLQVCPAYHKYILTVDDIDKLVVPLLKTMYEMPEGNSYHTFMCLINLLIMCEDDTFCRRIHQISLRPPPRWYTERVLSELSLGGLIILVITKVLHVNLIKSSDHYLHTNCLAALSNMSGEFRNLHPYVAQRLISLLEIINKKFKKMLKQLIKESPEDEVPSSGPRQKKSSEDLYWENAEALETVHRMLQEILNSCLSHQLQHNLNLVYVMLYKKDLFDSYTNDVGINLKMVIGFFSTRLKRIQEHAGYDLSVDEVLAALQKGAQQWTSDRLKKFPDLKFRYVEEELPEEFFTPYVWTLIMSCGCIHWTNYNGVKLLREGVVRDVVA